MHGFTSSQGGFLAVSLSCCLALDAHAATLNNAPSSPAVEMEAGSAYAAGTRLHIPKGSASFVIPPGWHAQLPEDSEAIIVVSEAGAGFVMVFMILNLTEDELTVLLGEPQPITHDLVFEPAGPIEKRGDRVIAAYESGSLSGRALTVLGPNQQGVLFFLGRPRSESNQTDRVLEELADSTEFAVNQ